MWKSSVRGLILSQIDFPGAGLPVNDSDRVITSSFEMLEQMAWFHRWPVVFLAATITLLSVIRFGKTLDRVAEEQRSRFIFQISRIPLCDLLTKLVGSIALLHRLDGNTRAPVTRS